MTLDLNLQSLRPPSAVRNTAPSEVFTGNAWNIAVKHGRVLSPVEVERKCSWGGGFVFSTNPLPCTWPGPWKDLRGLYRVPLSSVLQLLAAASRVRRKAWWYIWVTQAPFCVCLLTSAVFTVFDKCTEFTKEEQHSWTFCTRKRYFQTTHILFISMICIFQAVWYMISLAF